MEELTRKIVPRTASFLRRGCAATASAPYLWKPGTIYGKIAENEFFFCVRAGGRPRLRAETAPRSALKNHHIRGA